MVDLGVSTRFVLADIPGLIEGAAEGAGLGTRFLGHIERCKVLLHLIDGTQEDVVGAYNTIRSELTDYNAGLEDKPEILALNKIDSLTAEDIAEKAAALETASGKPPLLISGVSGEGVKQALGDIAKHLGVLAETEEEEDPSTSDTPQGWTP